jgi:PQQ-dependent dehydrogenase (methanol/ethanol family)
VPPLSGEGFEKRWPRQQQSMRNLYSLIKNLMPPQAPGSLAPAEAADLFAYILRSNNYPEGVSIAALSAMLTDPTDTDSACKLGGVSAGSLPARATTDRPTDSELLEAKPENWLMYNRDYKGRRFADLSQINRKNAGRLAAVCAFQTGETGSFQPSPLIYEGMLYVTTAMHTYAIDARTCRKIWDATNPTNADVALKVNRGAALYHGKLFRASPDGHLTALDAKTGALLWDVPVSDTARGYWLSAAPIASHGLVFMGEAGADFGVDAHLYAYDEESGRLRWTFDAIPRGQMKGADSWKNGANHGGGSMWSAFSADVEANLIYVSVGNPAPDFDGAARPGANLFTDSVVAVDMQTGKLAWYVQQVPHDIHDWDTVAAPTLFEQDGRKYLAVGNKEGYLYLYDRTTHQLLSRSEVTEHSNTNDEITAAGVHVCPGWLGGVEWNGAAYSPSEKMLFINSVHLCGIYKKAEEPFTEGAPYYGGEFIADPLGAAYGWTRGFDAASGHPVWAVRSPTPMISTVTATAGGLLLTGELNGDFKALDSKTSEELYRFNTGGAIAGGVSVYAIEGKEYIAVASGNTSRSTIWATRGAATVFVFSLPEDAR